MTQILAGETLLISTSYKIINCDLLVQQDIFMAMLTAILLNTLQQPYTKVCMPSHSNIKRGFTLL
jgi:hypothetical protein